MPSKKQNKFIYVLLGLILLVQAWQSYKISQTSFFLDSLGGDKEEVVSTLQKTKNYIKEFVADLNEIRTFLLIPTKTYNFEDAEDGEENDLEVLMYSFIDQLGKSEENKELFEENEKKTLNYFKNTDFSALNLSVVNASGEYAVDAIDFKLLDQKNSDLEIFTLSLNFNGSFYLSSYFEQKDIDSIEDFDSYIRNNVEDIRNAVLTNKELIKVLEEQIFLDKKVQDILKEKSLNLENGKEKPGEFFYEFKNKEGEILATLILNKKDSQFYFNNWLIEYEKINVTELAEKLKALDSRTSLEKKLETTVSEFETLINSSAFKSALKSSGLTIGEKKETDNCYLYPILKDGEEIRDFCIEKSSGEIRVQMPDGSAISDLISSLDAFSAQKKTFDLPIGFASEGVTDNPENFNILLLGKNGSNVDTIIFANINTDKRKMTIISIPRDLYFEDQKINSVYGEKGINEFIADIEEIVGYKIHNYVLLDMYAFRDIIDLIGGIDVTLEEDLIDPSYKVCDNAICSTLYYPAGTYHLNGTQALRVARSRHYSSDYSRAARQQLILEAIKAKALNLKIGDATKILALIKTVIQNTETDISAEESLLYYFRYQSFDLERGNVVSTANVLEAKQIPVDYITNHMETCEGKTDCEPGYVIDASYPKEGNWDYVRWYVRDVLAK